jgi:hypothetical protein
MSKLAFEQKKIFYEFWYRIVCNLSFLFSEQDIKNIPLSIFENSYFLHSIDKKTVKKLIKVYKIPINTGWVSLELTPYGKKVLKEFEIENLIS